MGFGFEPTTFTKSDSDTVALGAQETELYLL